jgi:hypothetical protein
MKQQTSNSIKIGDRTKAVINKKPKALHRALSINEVKVNERQNGDSTKTIVASPTYVLLPRTTRKNDAESDIYHSAVSSTSGIIQEQ